MVGLGPQSPWDETRGPRTVPTEGTGDSPGEGMGCSQQGDRWGHRPIGESALPGRGQGAVGLHAGTQGMPGKPAARPPPR